MADGVTFQTSALATPASGTEVATDDCGAAGHAQIVKLAISTDGDATPITADADGLLVNLGANNDVTISGVSTAANQTTIIGHLDGVEGLLTTIDTDTGNIATSVATVAGAVSGTEMQVDVLTMPTVTVDSELTTGDLDTGAGTDTRAVVGLVGSASGGGQLIPGSSTDGLLVNLGANNDVTVSGVSTAANQTTIIGHLDGVEGLLTTIDADTGTLAGAVSGTEVQVDIVAALPAGTNNIGDIDVLSVVPGTGATNLGKAEDAAHTSGDVGVMALAVRNDAGTSLVGLDGDYAPLQVNSAGALLVTGGGGGTEYTEGATDATITGSVVMWEDAADTVVATSAAKPFPVEIIAGAGSGGTAMTDDAAFTPATTAITPMGAMFDDVTPDSVDEGDGGVVRMSANRNLYVTLRDAAGNERGLNVDASGNIGVTDAGGAITVDGTVAVTGVATAANQTTIIGHLDGVEGLLTTIDADTSTLAGAVAGTEVQVDIVTMPAVDTELTTADLDTGAGTDTRAVVGLVGTASGGGQLIPGSSTDGLLVNLGANNDVTVSGVSTAANQTTIIGHLDGVEGLLTTIDTDTGNIATSVATVAGAVAGTEMQVDVLTMPTVTVDSELTTADLDTGAGTDTRAVVGLVGSASGGGALIPGSATDGLLVNLGANNDVTVTGTVTVGSHAVTNAGTFAVQVDGSALTALQLIDDPVFADDAAFTIGTSKVMMAGATVDEASIDSADEGDAVALRATPDRRLYVVESAHTQGGATPYYNLDVDETEDEVKATAGQVYWLHAMNLSNAKRYLKFYNATAANVTVGTTAPVLSFPIPTMADTNGAGFTIAFPGGVAFGTAITIAATTGFADNDTGAPGANEIIVNLGYK